MKKIVLFLHILVLILLLVTNLSIYISPENVPYLAFLGLAYPVTLILSIIFLVASIFLKQKIGYVNLVCIIGSMFHLSGFWGFGMSNDADTSFKVTSYNVRLFDKYEWLKKGSQTKDQIFEELDQINSDIYCFQEFYYEDKPGSFNTKKELSQLFKTKNQFGHFTHHMTGGLHFGLQMFSKYPIVDEGVITFKNDDNNSGIFCDIKINEDTIRVYNLHLGSIRFQNEDYAMFGDKTKMYKNKKGTQRIIDRIQTAYEKRASQVEQVATHINNSPHKVIVCGDINDTPVSYSYRKLKQDMKDAFSENSIGIGTTYSGKIPANRIDYILYNEELSTSQFSIQENTLSDHRAITADFN
jgi:endonuclease/exonuclease/phosphatase family metal-dependent hydrolase